MLLCAGVGDGEGARVRLVGSWRSGKVGEGWKMCRGERMIIALIMRSVAARSL